MKAKYGTQATKTEINQAKKDFGHYEFLCKTLDEVKAKIEGSKNFREEDYRMEFNQTGLYILGSCGELLIHFTAK